MWKTNLAPRHLRGRSHAFPSMRAKKGLFDSYGRRTPMDLKASTCVHQAKVLHVRPCLHTQTFLSQHAVARSHSAPTSSSQARLQPETATPMASSTIHAWNQQDMTSRYLKHKQKFPRGRPLCKLCCRAKVFRQWSHKLCSVHKLEAEGRFGP